MKPDLTPLALLGMFIIGDRAIAASAMVLIEVTADNRLTINLSTGEKLSLSAEDTAQFLRNLTDLMRQAQFGAGPTVSLKKH
jgi:hypothetical protein